ncbi:MAG: DUF3821 domain-containing protein [Methanomicrobiales archaeon]|nr:DUF3821 domain-containing protein [Methanomicrobiales archaeon]MDI6876616.1 DUF3821 domain-containing protein [Methanomicrobiales archaeon]
MPEGGWTPDARGIRTGCVALAVLLAVVVLVLPAAARGPTIKDIQPGDTVFVHERGLNLAALGGAGDDLASLVHYRDFSRQVIDRTIPVDDPGDFELLEFEVDGTYGIYYAWNRSGLIRSGDGVPVHVDIQEPRLALDVVLAAPYHQDSVQGLTISSGTLIAFEITSPRVGTQYRIDNTYPAQVDIVFLRPGGAETTVIGGRDMSGLNVSASRFYTDDPGRAGAVSLSGLEPGTYTFQARWRAPQEFADYAQDSNVVNFTVRGRPGVTITVSPTTPTETAPPPTTEPTTPPATLPTTAETTPPTTPPATETTVPPTTQAPLMPLLGVIGVCAAMIWAALKRR